MDAYVSLISSVKINVVLKAWFHSLSCLGAIKTATAASAAAIEEAIQKAGTTLPGMMT